MYNNKIETQQRPISKRIFVWVMNNAGKVIFACASVALLVPFGLAFLRFQYKIDIPILKWQDPELIERWGQLGDFLGGVLNPLLSFTALIAVLYNIRIQSSELDEARREAQANTSIQRKQAKSFDRQTFESTFFRMLGLHGDILRDISVEIASGKYSGREAIKVIESTVTNDPKFYSLLLDPNANLTSVRNVVVPLLKLYEPSISHYFRNLYQILKYLDEAEPLNDQDDDIHHRNSLALNRKRAIARFKKEYFRRRQYSNILRAQLSKPEINLIWMNCLTGTGEGLKHYVEMYSLLKGMPLKLPNMPGELLFDKLAYADYEDINFEFLRDKSLKYKAQRVKNALRPK